MAKYNKIEVISTMKETGIVPVFYHKDVNVAKKVLKACYDGGIRAFEFTNRGDFAQEVFGELVKYANAELPGMIVGVGSVVDPATAALYIQLGANFVVGPLFNPEIAPSATAGSSPTAPVAAASARSARLRKWAATSARSSLAMCSVPLS